MLPKKTLHAILFFLIALLPINAVSEQPTILHDAEIDQLNYSQNEWQKELQAYKQHLELLNDTQPYGNTDTSLQKTGPSIAIIDPSSMEGHYRATIPLQLLVYLKSRHAPIDLNTLKVKGKRGIFSINITDRLRGYLREAKNAEDADYVIDAKIPKLGAGHYRVVLSLADIDGNSMEHSAFIEVVKQ